MYTDGSCPENSKSMEKNCKAGWGIAIFTRENGDAQNPRKLVTGLFGPVESKHAATNFLGAEFGSNNIGELSAIGEVLKWLLEQESAETPVALYYDSKYAAKISTGEYTAEINKYLAAKARSLLTQVKNKRKIRLEHIKGHSKDEGNDAADELANKGANGATCRNANDWNSIKDSHPERAPEKEQRGPPTQQAPTNPNEIRIPLPVYQYGACRRARFAFGRITASQARTNTAEHFRMQNPDPGPTTEETERDFEEEDIFHHEDIPDSNDCA